MILFVYVCALSPKCVVLEIKKLKTNSGLFLNHKDNIIINIIIHKNQIILKCDIGDGMWMYEFI